MLHVTVINEPPSTIPAEQDLPDALIAGTSRNCRLLTAMRIDREADFELQHGRHTAAERLSHEAAMLRQAVTA